ncbi:MAG: hypothetical protein ACHQRL_00550 [Gemmatimonadales bacterium]|jgi:hypothetical protein
MPSTPRRRSLLVNTLLAFIVVLSGVLATPWAAGLRNHLRPQLPILIVVLCTISGSAQIVFGLVKLFSAPCKREEASFQLSFGMSGLLLALTFLPATTGAAPRTSTLWGAVFLGLLAVALQHRSRVRSEP